MAHLSVFSQLRPDGRNANEVKKKNKKPIFNQRIRNLCLYFKKLIVILLLYLLFLVIYFINFFFRLDLCFLNLVRSKMLTGPLFLNLVTRPWRVQFLDRTSPDKAETTCTTE
jgi:hypothetical protein